MQYIITYIQSDPIPGAQKTEKGWQQYIGPSKYDFTNDIESVLLWSNINQIYRDREVMKDGENWFYEIRGIETGSIMCRECDKPIDECVVCEVCDDCSCDGDCGCSNCGEYGCDGYCYEEEEEEFDEEILDDGEE